MNLPVEFTERMKMLLGDEYDAFIHSYEEPRHFGLRVNTLKCDPEKFERSAPVTLTRVPWILQGCYYVKENTAARHPYYNAGVYYLQEPSAMTPADVLPVEPGEKVLDLCAAPGGKATALGARLKGSGLLVANDISAARARALLHNIETFGIVNAAVTNAVPASLAERFPGFFDKVLVDAPCSGEGMFRKDEDTVKAWSPDKPARCAAVSRSLVLSAADMLRPGGMMLYSTCTFATEENEEVIAHLLRERPEMELIPVPVREGFAPGIALPGADPAVAKRCVRLWPHRIGGEGHFMALLRKAEDASFVPSGTFSPSGAVRSRSGSGPSKEELALIDGFFEGIGFEGGAAALAGQSRLKIASSKAYLVPEAFPEISGISILRNGLFLGELKKNRFEPSQSLALALDASLCSAKVCFKPDDPALTRYLKGEVLEEGMMEGRTQDLSNGWKLVCVDEYPLGWGKMAGARLKNHLPGGWRLS